MAALGSRLIAEVSHSTHEAGEHCPWCEQLIPRERFREVSNRIAARERDQHAATVARLREEFQRDKAAAEIQARGEAERAAETRYAERFSAIEAARASETAKVAAERAAFERDKSAALAAEQARAEAARQGLIAEIAALKETGRAAAAEMALQRETAERERMAALHAEQTKSLEEKQRFIEKIAGLQKQLENKTAQELGEGPEVDLFEVLRTAFEGDRIRRVLKGTQGADVIHEIVHNGRIAGKIVYDSKNRNAWKNDFVTKLRADQMAERADHAVLSSNKFPAGAQHLHLQDGVVVVSPQRVAVVAEVLRRHIIGMFGLRMSNDDREEKSAALYAFITSERCGLLIGSLETQADKLVELDVAEEKQHRLTWDRRSRLIGAVRRVHGDLTFEIDRVLGTTGSNGSEDEAGCAGVDET